MRPSCDSHSVKGNACINIAFVLYWWLNHNLQNVFCKEYAYKLYCCRRSDFFPQFHTREIPLTLASNCGKSGRILRPPMCERAVRSLICRLRLLSLHLTVWFRRWWYRVRFSLWNFLSMETAVRSAAFSRWRLRCVSTVWQSSRLPPSNVVENFIWQHFYFCILPRHD